MESKEKLIKIKDSIGNNLWLNSWVKEPLIELIDKALNPTPTTIESQFSKDELEFLQTTIKRYWSVMVEIPMVYKTQQKLNHLLTADNEFPKMMEVSADGNKWSDEQIEVDGMYKDVYMIKSDNPNVWYGYKHARPIAQKVKELKDLKPNENAYYIGESNATFTFGKGYAINISTNSGFKILSNTGSQCFIAYHDSDFSPYPPTPQQIESARQSAIDKINELFDMKKKEATNV